MYWLLKGALHIGEEADGQGEGLNIRGLDDVTGNRKLFEAKLFMKTSVFKRNNAHNKGLFVLRIISITKCI